MCHHCGHKTSVKKKCKDIDSNCEFQMYGPGVEKIFSELKQIFPEKKIKILSSDFLSKKKETENLLEDIENNKVNILLMVFCLHTNAQVTCIRSRYLILQCIGPFPDRFLSVWEEN